LGTVARPVLAGERRRPWARASRVRPQVGRRVPSGELLMLTGQSLKLGGPPARLERISNTAALAVYL
jgi:hypothetical protein